MTQKWSENITTIQDSNEFLHIFVHNFQRLAVNYCQYAKLTSPLDSNLNLLTSSQERKHTHRPRPTNSIASTLVRFSTLGTRKFYTKQKHSSKKTHKRRRRQCRHSLAGYTGHGLPAWGSPNPLASTTGGTFSRESTAYPCGKTISDIPCTGIAFLCRTRTAYGVPNCLSDCTTCRMRRTRIRCHWHFW